MKLTLTQKVVASVICVSLIASALTGWLVAKEVKNVYLSEQQRNVADLVQNQARIQLRSADFQVSQAELNQPRFATYSKSIATSKVVRVKIYDTNGIVLYSDEAELIGQKLFGEEEEELREILSGQVVADISKPNKKENAFESQFGELLEIYVPISFNTNEVVGIVETYFQLDLLNKSILKSQLYLVTSILSIFLLLLITLFLLVRKASQTLLKQSAQLKKDIEKEKEYSAIKDEFIEMSSHQLRTPASAIKWLLELFTEQTKPSLNKEQREALDSIKTNNELLISIVNNLLIVSSIKPDYFTFENKPYNLAELINEVLKNNKQKIKSKQIQLTLKTADDLPQISIKKSALLLVLKSLIENALDYTPPAGTITILVTVKNKHFLSLTISDTGIGVPQSEQTHLFDKFFRAKNAVEQKNVGSGLGLYIAKKIAQGYKGDIQFSPLVKGSQFILELPIPRD
jgi:signal transduction histidine kinase